ncbi:transposase domain-containing protein, partial [Vibrio sp. 10N.286.51.F4]|uniref:transposase domain-containing protein n=1 Tax=Vibrio sp. 10N.286.51.F4 TaxID=3229710 RepID=UPI00354C871B
PLVIGRKNWLFSNTPNGADASAMLYSIIETAKANGLILYDYMVKCMKELAKAEPDIDALLPWTSSGQVKTDLNNIGFGLETYVWC